MNVRLIVLGAALGATALGTVASAAPQPMYNTTSQFRSDRGSDRNIRAEISRIEGVIDMLQRDRHDYGGHREQAIDLLQRAREQLGEALQYDNTHR